MVIDFPYLEFLVSVLVADVRGRERKRRTKSHVKPVSEVFVCAALGVNIENGGHPK
jgi:hypothetical protein